MTIQVNAEKLLSIHETFENQLKVRLANDFKRFDEHITTLDVHIMDENGIKTGFNDIKCMLEAHLKRLQSVVVSESANTLEQSVHRAVYKLKESLGSVIGRARDHAHHATK